MAVSSSLGTRIVAKELVIQRLLENALLVGGIYTMGYDECLVLTNDLWKKQAGGVPQHCFLLATAMTPSEAPDEEDEEIILLRVVGPAALPAEAELVQIRADAMREMVVTRGQEVASAPPAILDVLTRNEIQFSAVKAKILGTFYEVDVDRTPILAFGSDMETYYSSSRYKVYKPYGDSLSIIASYPEMTVEEEADRQRTGIEPRRVRIGTVRYSSTTRRRNVRGGATYDTAVPVRVNVTDFIALKTAVFGMTRLGKSNTMKTIATAICRYAAETRQRIGQLLFDPAGEYANVNVQDRTALAEMGPEFVTIFRYGADGTQPGVRPLSLNFFSEEVIDVTWSIITAYLTPRNQSTYVRSFLAADVIGPQDPEDDRSAYNRARRRRCALYAVLQKAGFAIPPAFRMSIVANQDVIASVNHHLTGNRTPFATAHGTLWLNADDLMAFWDSLLAARNGGTHMDDWIDAGLDAILQVYQGSVGAGWRLLEPLRVYHSLVRTDDYAEEILQELVNGRIVIVDMSLGTETVVRFCSERIVNHIVQDAARRFASGEDLNQIQVYIEEAHRLFNRDRMSAPEEADPYVRLAKEAAKYQIGLIYATQEVSSVDPIILSNTSNWIVTHLNNHVEVKELAKYYDFQDFSGLTLKAEDVGFTRIKTRSGRYIIPTQIDKFEETRVQEARLACLEALAAQSAEGA